MLLGRDKRSTMRLDKFLSQAGAGSRSEVKQAVRKGLVSVNGNIIKDAAAWVAEEKDVVCLKGRPLSFSKHHYYMLHKPAGVVTATKDNRQKTVLDLLTDISVKGLFPVGRLDKDTEGLLLLTDDGALAHKLLAPKKHVDKTYLAEISMPLSLEAADALRRGVDIGEEKPTAPAKVELIEERRILITIQEGRYHQIKRMLKAVGNEVLYLKRLSMGGLVLDENLKKGEFRPLKEAEIEDLKKESTQDGQRESIEEKTAGI